MTTQQNPMDNPLDASSVIYLLKVALTEIFESPQGFAMVLDKDSGLFDTLAGISAAQASQAMGSGCATIAAHVDHTRYYLDTIEKLMFAQANINPDWGEIWKTVTSVTEDEWAASIAALRASYDRVKAHFDDSALWVTARPMAAMMGMVVHTAYHLGEIRQMLCHLDDVS